MLDVRTFLKEVSDNNYKMWKRALVLLEQNGKEFRENENFTKNFQKIADDFYNLYKDSLRTLNKLSD